ncbi:Dynein heavy chain [Glycine soja]
MHLNLLLSHKGGPLGTSTLTFRGLHTSTFKGLHALAFRELRALTFRGLHVVAFRGLHALAFRGLHVLTIRGLHVLAIRGPHALAFKGLHVLNFRGLHVLPFKGLHVLTFRGLHVLTFRGLHALAFIGLHALTFRGLHVLTFRGLHVLTFRGLHVLTFRGLHALAFRGLHVLAFRGLHILTLRGLHVLTIRGLHVLAFRGLRAFTFRGLHVLAFRGLHVLAFKGLHVLAFRGLHALAFRGLHILVIRRLHALAFRGLHVLAFRGLHILPFRGLHVLPFRGLHALPFRGLHILTFKGLHVLTFRGLHTLTFKGLHVLTFREQHVLSFRGLRALTFRGIHVLAFRGLHVLAFRGLHALAFRGLHVMQSYPPRVLDRRLQEDWARATKEGSRVLMTLRAHLGGEAPSSMAYSLVDGASSHLFSFVFRCISMDLIESQRSSLHRSPTSKLPSSGYQSKWASSSHNSCKSLSEELRDYYEGRHRSHLRPHSHRREKERKPQKANINLPYFLGKDNVEANLVWEIRVEQQIKNKSMSKSYGSHSYPMKYQGVTPSEPKDDKGKKIEKQAPKASIQEKSGSINSQDKATTSPSSSESEEAKGEESSEEIYPQEEGQPLVVKEKCKEVSISSKRLAKKETHFTIKTNIKETFPLRQPPHFLFCRKTLASIATPLGLEFIPQVKKLLDEGLVHKSLNPCALLVPEIVIIRHQVPKIGGMMNVLSGATLFCKIIHAPNIFMIHVHRDSLGRFVLIFGFVTNLGAHMGHLSDQGVPTDPKRIKVIPDWPTPPSVEGRSPEYEEPRDLRSNPFQGGGDDAILPPKVSYMMPMMKLSCGAELWLDFVNGKHYTPKDPLYKILDELRSLKLWKEKQERKENGKKRVEEISQDEREKIREEERRKIMKEMKREKHASYSSHNSCKSLSEELRDYYEGRHRSHLRPHSYRRENERKPQEANINLPYFHGKDNVEAYLDWEIRMVNTIKIEKFIGKNSFRLWCIKMQSLLKERGIWAPPSSQSSKIDKSMLELQEEKSHSLILLSLSDEFLLKWRLLGLQIREGIPMKEHLDEINYILMELRALLSRWKKKI